MTLDMFGPGMKYKTLAILILLLLSQNINVGLGLICLISLKSFLNQTTSLVPSINAWYFALAKDRTTDIVFFHTKRLGSLQSWECNH